MSHLVQATRAGAEYGHALWWVLLLAIISKYPFLEFGSRFAAGTGKHLIDGYKQMGKLPLMIYTAITIGTMFIIIAAVTIVTSGLAEHLFQWGWTPFTWSAVILAFCVLILVLGKYHGLDFLMKVIITLLALATLLAVLMALGAVDFNQFRTYEIPDIFTTAAIGFIIAFMGWMPIPLDASVWHSIWTLKKAEQPGQSLSPEASKTDFNIGYLSAAFIGLLFFLLGILVMFGSRTVFSDNSFLFSAQLIDLYGNTLGAWSKPLIAAAAFITMFSTVIAVTDAYPRVVTELIHSGEVTENVNKQKSKTYLIALITIPLFSLAILFFLTGSFKQLVDFAAGLSFLSAPFLAWFNYKLITGSQMPKELRPSKTYRLFSLCCLVLLILFCGVYFWYYFIELK